MRRDWAIITAWMVLLGSLLSGAAAIGAIPAQINYQAKLTDSSGSAVADGDYTMRFNIYDAARCDQPAGEGCAALWSEERPAGVSVRGGFFNVALGSVVPLDLPFDRPYWLEVVVRNDATGADESLGRRPLTSVPYAHTAESVVNEEDPLFAESPAAGIGAADTANWNAAYAWGNHASAGYLTSYTETDPTLTLAKMRTLAGGDFHNLGGAETDPEVGANSTGYSPKWDGSKLVTGAIHQDGSGNVGIGTASVPFGDRLTVAGGITTDYLASAESFLGYVEAGDTYLESLEVYDSCDIVGGLSVQGGDRRGTGTVACSGTSVTGVGTLFRNQLHPGDTITAAGQTKTVTAIASHTSLTVDQYFSPTVPAGTAFTYAEPLCRLTDSDGADKVVVTSEGNIGIGAAPESDVKLRVAGLTIVDSSMAVNDEFDCQSLIVESSSMLQGSVEVGGTMHCSGNVGVGCPYSPQRKLHIKDTAAPPLRYDCATSTGRVAVDKFIPVDVNGVTYYIRLYQ